MSTIVIATLINLKGDRPSVDYVVFGVPESYDDALGAAEDAAIDLAADTERIFVGVDTDETFARWALELTDPDYTLPEKP
jgi:hypothetical protein